jgi:hypothetical protein
MIVKEFSHFIADIVVVCSSAIYGFGNHSIQVARESIPVRERHKWRGYTRTNKEYHVNLSKIVMAMLHTIESYQVNLSKIMILRTTGIVPLG